MMATPNNHLDSNRSRNRRDDSLVLVLPRRFYLLSYLASILLAFAVGRLARHHILNQAGVLMQLMMPPKKQGLPLPTLPEGKKTPNTIYASKHYGGSGIVSSSDSLLSTSNRRRHESTSNKSKSNWVAYKVEEEAKEESIGELAHEPAGEHILVDIENVDAFFLNSEERLARAMIDLINFSGLTLLSYHCHKLQPLGVSCVGILLESHVSFHTWPLAGVITLDLFTCGPTQLVPLVPVVEKLFGVPNVPVAGKASVLPRMVWAHKRRGFHSKELQFNPEDIDLTKNLLGDRLWDKILVATVETKFQTIDIYDAFESRYESRESYQRSLTRDGSYESKNPELFQYDRIVFLDRIMQSRRFGERAYHEALVHPVMLTHRKAKRVAIIGGGEGATLREVLKHKTVEQVVMIEIDEAMVNTSRTYLSEWSDCSNLIGSTESCFDDPRATVYYEDAIAWFVDRYAHPDNSFQAGETFDVIILDSLDPSSAVSFSDMMYDNSVFSEALSNALGEEGLLVAQVGELPKLSDPPFSMSRDTQQLSFLLGLEKAGFEYVTNYDENLCGFSAPWSFLVAMKDIEYRANWHASESEQTLWIRKNAMETKTGELPFRYFDGSEMTGYRFPSRVQQELFCRQEPEECKLGSGFDPAIVNYPLSSFEVKQSGVANSGRGVYAKERIPQGSYLGLEASVHSILIMPLTYQVLAKMLKTEHDYFFTLFIGYLDGYAWDTFTFGERGSAVDSDIMTFVNHGCNGTYNTGDALDVTEQDISADGRILEILKQYNTTDVFNPFEERNHHVSLFTSNREIVEGDELLDNYLLYSCGHGLEELKAMCNGKDGIVTQYEHEEL